MPKISHASRVPFQRVSGLGPRAQDEINRNFEAVVDQVVPTGGVMPWAGKSTLTEVPSGWLLCDGTAVNRLAYGSLFAVIGTTYGAGDGSTTFNLPNLTTRFPRGNTTPGGTGGTSTATMPSHSHGGATLGDGAFNVGHDQNHGSTGVTEPPNHVHNGTTGDIDRNHTHSVNSVVFMNCSATHGHGGGCGQLAESPSYGGCTGFGCNGATGTVSQGHLHNFTTAGVASGIAHSHTGPPGHSNHSVGSHTHLISAEGSGDNLPPYVDFRFLIKT